MRNKLKNVPLYPLIPFGPLALAGAFVVLETFALVRLSRLTRLVSALVEKQQPQPVM